MNVNGTHYRTIWLQAGNSRIVEIIDQRALSHRFLIEKIATSAAMASAISEMHVRGAGLIGAAAGYGMYLAALEVAPSRTLDRRLAESGALLKSTRPTTVNLA